MYSPLFQSLVVCKPVFTDVSADVSVQVEIQTHFVLCAQENGRRWLQPTSVQLSPWPSAEGVLRVSVKGNERLEQRENASFSLQTVGLVCLNFLLSSLGLQVAT